MKLKTELYKEGKLQTTAEYSGAYVYENGNISYINIPDGRIRKDALHASHYEYNLTDHLGNVRVTFGKGKEGKVTIMQEDHYYPFGMRMNGQHYTNTDLLNKFLYNGKELQEQTGYYNYGFRQLDPALGRWHVADAHAESYYSHSPYAYVLNNPVSNTDLLGLDPEYPPWNENPYGDAYLDLPTPGWFNSESFNGFTTFRRMEVGPTSADYDAWLALGGGAEGSSFSAWYGFGGRAGMNLNDYTSLNGPGEGAYFWDEGTNTLQLYSKDSDMWIIVNLGESGASVSRNDDGTTNWGNISNKIAYGATTAEFLMGLANIAEKDINLAKAVKFAKLNRARGIVGGFKYVEYAKYAQFLKNKKLLVKAGYVTSGIAEFSAYIEFELSKKKRSDYVKFSINTASNILTAIPNPWTIGIGLLIGAGDYAGLYDGLYNFLDNPVRNVNYNYLAEPNW